MSKASNINGIKVILHDLDNYDNDLKELGDQFRAKHKNNGIFILSSKQDDKLNIMCAITDDLMSSIDASNIAKEIGAKIDGGGGGKRHIATAGGKNIVNIDDLFKQVCDYLNVYLK